MGSFFSDLSELYERRQTDFIDAFLDRWIAPDCVVAGTALGELMQTRDAIRGLFDSDLRYWYPLCIDTARAERTEFSDLALLACPASISYDILEDEQRYRSYASWCDGIAHDPLPSPSQKAARISFILDTLLASRKSSRRTNRLTLTIRALMRGEQIIFLSFSFDKNADTADDYLGDSTDTQQNYTAERNMLKAANMPAVRSFLASQGLEDCVFSSPDGRVFYGLGVRRRIQTLDEAMADVLAAAPDADPYRALFDLRLRISYLQRIYALEEHPRAVLRFFGLAGDDGVTLFQPTYPLSAYMEWN